MTDEQCVAFLQWALPRLQRRWRGYRKVRRQVCRRITRRCRELGLEDFAAYRDYLKRHPAEWQALDQLTNVTISRFYRDPATWIDLEQHVLPALARMALGRGARRLDAWSVGCASGEEPYTLVLLWELLLRPSFRPLELAVLGTDVDEAMLRRAADACYAPSSLKELPAEWQEAAFTAREGGICLRPRYRRAVTLARHDVRDSPPDGPFDVVLCRNLAFTYFDGALQRELATRLADVLRPGGALVVGTHESPPSMGLTPWPGCRGVLRRSLAPNPRANERRPPREAAG